MNNKIIITKESLINKISDECECISIEELNKLIERAADKHGIISKNKLIRLIRSCHTKKVVKDIYSILEDSLLESLSKTNKKRDVCIRLFDGVSLEGAYLEEKTKKNNLTGEMRTIPSKIKPKFNVTRYYCEKVNNK